MSRTKNATRNIIWGVVYKLISLGLPFITRTVMIHTMGMQYVGLGSLFTSVLQVLSFAELGIGHALVFSMYKPVATNDENKVCALLNLYRKAYRIIGVVILGVGLILFPFLDLLVEGEIPDGISLQALFAVYLANNLIGYFLYAYKQSLFVANQRVDTISKINASLQLVLFLLQIILLTTTHNYYLYVIAIPFITIINNLIIGWFANKSYPQYRCVGVIGKDESREIRKKVGGMVFQKIGSIILDSVDTIVISAFLGLTTLALFQNYFLVITALLGIMSVVMQSIIAVVGNSVATETLEKNYNDFQKFNLIYIWIISWCSCCLICLFQPFIQLWIGKEALLDITMVFLLAAYFFVHKWCDMLYVYQEACGIWWETKFVPLIAACVNLVVNIILVQCIGLAGILISTIVAVVFVYDIGYARVLFKKYFNIPGAHKKYWIKQAFYCLSATLICCFTYWLCNLISVDSLVFKLIINTLLCIVLPNVLFILLWGRLPEYKNAKELVSRIIHKCKKGG